MINKLCLYLDAIRIKYETSEGTTLYMISLMCYCNAPFSRLVRLKSRCVHAIFFFDGTWQRSTSWRPRGYINTIMTSS